MRWRCITSVVLTMTAFMGAVAISHAEDAGKGANIQIPLKDFKFKPPASVVDPDSVFVFNEEEVRLCFYTDGPAEAKFTVPSDGEWEVIVTASGDSAMGVPGPGGKEETVRPNFQLGFDGKDFGKEVTLKSDDVQDYTVVIPLTSGQQ